MKLAERKASMARKWSEAEDGEDLASILREDGHGLTVYEEPESPNTGKPLGITYFRIDENRILMMRKPLEVIGKITQKKHPTLIWNQNYKPLLRCLLPECPSSSSRNAPLPPPNFVDTE